MFRRRGNSVGRLYACLFASLFYGIDWIDPSGGVYGDGTNWAGGIVPGPSDISIFNVDATYTVDINSNHTVSQLFLEDGDVTFDASGQTLEASIVVYVGRNSGDEATFRLIDGTLSTGQTFVAHAAGSTGAAHVTGVDTLWTSSSNNFVIGSGGPGTLTIAEGAHVLRTGFFNNSIIGQSAQPVSWRWQHRYTDSRG
jgi:T5SS/PEP-CTERM-associated repeat protein